MDYVVFIQSNGLMLLPTTRIDLLHPVSFYLKKLATDELGSDN